MDQTIRNKLRSVVTQCRKLLEDSIAQALQGRFGMYAVGKKVEIQIEDGARMVHLTEDDRACRQDLLDKLQHIQVIGYKPSEALEQLVRQIAFTHLNRLCAYKMMESRGLIREAVSRGPKSQGFFFYLSDHPEDEKLHDGGGQETAYRNFLDWLGGTLSQEIGVLFNPNDPANRIYPPQRVLDEVLAQINDGELKDIWSQDETIGWIYQYFTPKELRDKARKLSPAPRNSYELAFRNQFFTPRYVVEFLTDNTLGRIWYEMRKGDTVLKDRCRYLVRRPNETFLKEGENPPVESKDAREDLSQEELLKQPLHIPHRPKKDPRAIKGLDPACGSGHFLLYFFDLLWVIYEEAYDDPDLSAALRTDYPAIEDLRRALPGLILEHNLHGIDIDLRATQIAALALWLRCQRAYQDLGLNNGDRPKITRSNIVCAEPMPGETDLLKEFTATLQPKVLGQLVEAVFEKMKLAGEAGSLLKIEEDIRDAAMTAKKEYQEELRRQKQQAGYLPGMAPSVLEPTLFDFSDMTDNEFLNRAEEEIVAALRQYAEKASNGGGFRRRLFTEDAARGFGFLDLSRRQYDVILMNPPFGEFAKAYKAQARDDHPNSYNDIFAAFTERWYWRLTEDGSLGAITSRVGFFLTSFKKWRTEFLLRQRCLSALVDLGEAVMDEAMVESAAYVLHGKKNGKETIVLRLLGQEDRGEKLCSSIGAVCKGNAPESLFVVDLQACATLPNAPIVYWIDPHVIVSLARHPHFEPAIGQVRCGLSTGDNFRFVRLLWEVTALDFQNRWFPLVMTGASQPWFSPLLVVVDWKDDGKHLAEYEGSTIRSREFYFRPGFSWTRRAVRFVPYAIPAGCIPSASRYQAYPSEDNEFVGLGLTASNMVSAVLRFYGEKFKWPNFLVDNVKGLPCPVVSERLRQSLIAIVQKEVNQRRRAYQNAEPFHEFVAPSVFFNSGADDALSWNIASILGEHIELEIAAAYGLTRSAYDIFTRDLREAIAAVTSFDSRDEEIDENSQSQEEIADVVIPEDDRGKHEAVVSYLVGIVFGRWDIRIALDPSLVPELPEPFDPLPVCPPGMLQGPNGLPAKPEDMPSNYPVSVHWNGILVDDPEHEDDIVRCLRDAMEVTLNEHAEDRERAACEILGVRELRDYFRKPGNGGYWVDHVKRYSKSRRKAPIYWYLRSTKGNYGLWLYYHRLDKDILFKALQNYVEPKIRLEEDRLKMLRGRKEAAGSSGSEAKQIEKDMDRKEQFVSELRDFADKLRRAANLHLDPDLNDGVVLNIASLWEFVPWKEAKEYWEELVGGEYEWSSIGKQLREKGIVR